MSVQVLLSLKTWLRTQPTAAATHSKADAAASPAATTNRALERPVGSRMTNRLPSRSVYILTETRYFAPLARCFGMPGEPMAKKAKSNKNDIQTVAFVSLGCPKNLVDSERMLGLL